MNDFSGVDPERVRLLANRLKTLADTLEREAPGIRKHFDDWHGTISQSLLFQQVTQMRKDAGDMAKRADLALQLAHIPHYGNPDSPTDGFVNVPWDVSRIDVTREAQQEAQLLKNAMDDPDDPESRKTVAEVAQSMADHKDDPAYMQAFMANGGLDQAARAARVLHGQDGTSADETVLSKQSEAILAQFGQGVQAATTMARQGRITMPPDWEKKLTQPADGDMWSVGMLFKYGPPGDKWDAKVLSDVGGAMLDWRSSQEMRPQYAEPTTTWSGGYIDPDQNAWYVSLGLNYDGGKNSEQKRTSISANDPSIALMQRVSENPDAARDLLTDDTKCPDGKTRGFHHAQVLVSNKWHTPGLDQLNDAKFPAAVIRAATLDRTHHPKESVEAAANVINAAGDEYTLEQNRKPEDRKNYPSGNTEMTHTLSSVFQAYVPDFAACWQTKNQPAAPSATDDTQLTLGKVQADLFLNMIMQNPKEPGNMLQAIDSQVTLTTMHGLTEDNLDDINNLAALRGEIFGTQSADKIHEAEMLDTENSHRELWFNIFSSGTAAIPNGTKLGPWGQAAIWAGIPYADTLFSTDNAATAESQYQKGLYDQEDAMRIPVMQGMLRSGKVAPPKSRPEWAGGNIVIRTTADSKAFNDWWTELTGGDHKDRIPELNTANSGMWTYFEQGSGRSVAS
ncbi:hypothetical protein [Streptomyces sp. NRRL F-5123]|uniref:hypothetical protein n=1 Tax=Streptomyces sp. NRRL F-5123 TaxID=1463856 RepID=UPI0004E2139C|nr:hypothetical protein [Streptomyces sp. NRRL F-5123]